MSRILKVILMLFVLFGDTYAEVLYHPYNLDFEEGSKYGIPNGWFLPTYAEKAGYKAEISNEKPFKGKYCLKLSIKENPGSGVYGSVMQSINAENYRGKRIRFRAAVRTELEGDSSTTHLWLRTHLSNKQTGFVDLMEDRPIVIGDWNFYEITGYIDESAVTINYGLMLKGWGKAWIDAAEFEIIREDTMLFEKPKTLTKQSVENIKAFAQIMRYARFFYPGTEAVNTDWEHFALTGIEYVEDAANNNELLNKLNQLFNPIAPGILIYNSSEIPKDIDYAQKPQEAIDNVALVYKHTGLSPTGEESAVFEGGPFNIYQSTRRQDGIATQLVNAETLRGKKLRYSVFVKTDLKSISGQAQLIAAIEFDNKNITPLTYKLPLGIKSKHWEKNSIEFTVPNNANRIRLGIVLIGEGKAFFDETSLRVIEDEKEGAQNYISNPSFEQDKGTKLVYGWKFVNEEKDKEYYGTILEKGAYFGKQCFEIKSDEETLISFPKPGDKITTSIGAGLSITMPLTLFIDSMQTLPYPKSSSLKIKSKYNNDFVLTCKDRTSRLAITSLLWGILRTFSIYNDSDEEWNFALEKAIASSSQNQNLNEYISTLSKLTVPLNDCQARIWSDQEDVKASFPFNWRILNDKVYISQTAESFKLLSNGDEVIAINGVPMLAALDSVSQQISAADVRWKYLRSLAELKAGKLGSKEKLTVVNAQTDTVVVEVERNIYFSELTEQRPPAFYRFEKEDINYIDLTRFDDKEMKDTVKYLRLADKIIFDLRGFTSVSEYFLGMFTEEKLPSVKWKIPILVSPNKKDNSSRLLHSNVTSLPLQLSRKIVFLADERSIGYSEGILSVVKHYKLGKIIGRKTASAPGEVSVMRLPGNFYLSMTSMYGISPDGKYINKTGVIPDITVEPTIEGISDGDDEVLMNAMGYLYDIKDSK